MLSRFALVISIALSCSAPHAQDWKPARNVEIVVSSGAGAADRQARTTQRFLQAMPGMPSVTVSNRPGGAGTVAWTFVNQHPGDAHYLGTMNVTLVTNQVLGVSKLRYQDLTPLNIQGVAAALPTFREQGIDAVYYAWRGFLGPAGLTPAQIAFWDQAFAKIVKDDEWKKVQQEFQWVDDYRGAADTRKHLDSEFALLQKILADLGVAAK